MAEPPGTPLVADRIGPDAARTLARTRTPAGVVIAGFRRTVWLDLEGGLLCLACGTETLGPLTLAVRERDRMPETFVPGTSVHVDGQRMTVGSSLVIELARASPWQPPPWPSHPHPVRVAGGLAQLRRRLPPAALATGLGGFVARRPQLAPTHRTALHAQEAIMAARTWLAGRGRGDRAAWARELIGLGPGLTPSGDDFLGGVLLALHAIGARGMACRLWTQLAAPARVRTHAISHALLAAAARGRGGERVHRALCTLLQGADLSVTLDDLGRIGQSSGWDTLAGLVLVLEGYADQTMEAAA